MKNHLELDDLVYTYPDVNQATFQTLLTSKEEYRKTASQTSEPVPRRGELFKHQQYLLRLMREYDNQLIIWRTGTGKSCGVIAVTEYYKTLANVLENIRTDDSVPYKHAYVLVKGPSLGEEFKNQLVCKCTDGDYITDLVRNSTSDRQRKNNITRSINTFYTVSTYGAFARILVNLTDDQIKQQYDHSIFIIDEVHNLKLDETKGKVIIDPKTGNSIVVKTEKSEKNKKKSEKSKKKSEKSEKKREAYVEQRLIYDQLWRIFHIISPRKVMLLSATPMINDPSEIAPILNLILPIEKQLPLNISYSDLTIQQFEPYLRGLISFVRELDTGAIPEYIGSVIDTQYEIQGRLVPSQMVIYGTKMSEHQEKIYNIAVNNPKSLKPKSDKPGAFFDLQRQAANFVFPDGSTGRDGFNRYVSDLGNGNYSATPELAPWLSNYQNLSVLSSKFAEIVRLSKETPGNSWCYSSFVIGSGAILLSLCFEGQGFTKFNESSSIFLSTGGTELAPLCAPETIKGMERGIRIEKKLRYALLTSNTSGPETSSLLEAFNSYENRHGEYIKAIIGSPVTRDGLNLANVLQIHLVGPGWNQATTYQAESRAIRSTSHVDLLAEERERIRLAGGNPDFAFVTINVYRHAAATSEGTSIDVHMYQQSEQKDREIKRIMRMMKQTATDCQIHYSRNVRANDIDGSAQCDYDVCDYGCYDPAPTFIDYTSYDVLYSGDIVEGATNDIKEIFKTKFNIKFTELYKTLKQYREKFIDEAVGNLIDRKIPIVDRYGYTSYLREDGGSLFLQRDFPLETYEKKGGYALSIYTETLIGIQEMSLNEYVGNLQKDEQVGLIETLQTLDPSSTEFNKLIDDLNLENKVDLLEQAIYQLFVNKKQSQSITAIINKYITSTFEVLEPLKAIEITSAALANRGKGRGRKPKVGSKLKLTTDQQDKIEEAVGRENEQGEKVYIHTLYNRTHDRTSYGVSAKFSKGDAGRIRILKPSEGTGWRDASPYELPVYNTIVQRTLEGMRSPFEKFDIYGTILEDRIFRIRDKTTESKTTNMDKRHVNRGRTCSSWNKTELIEILWKLNVMPFKTQHEKTRGELLSYLEKANVKMDINQFSDDKLKFFYIWLVNGLNRDKICEQLQKALSDMGRLLVL